MESSTWSSASSGAYGVEHFVVPLAPVEKDTMESVPLRKAGGRGRGLAREKTVAAGEKLSRERRGKW